MQPNGMRVLHALGLASAVERVGARISHWCFSDQHGTRLCDTDLAEVWGSVGPFIGIERRELHRVLIAGATHVPARLGTSVVTLAHEGDHIVVGFNDGARRTYGVVVGCDGVYSTVRSFMPNAAPLVKSGQTAWRSVASVRPRGLSRLQFLLGDGSFVGLCPTGGGRTYGFFNVTGPRAHDPLGGRLARLRERFAGYGDVVQEYLGSLESDAQIHCSAIEWIAHADWGTNRVPLIGDAAHACSPMMGQGGCMALEDAYVLADALHNAENVERAHAAFIARRTPRIEWVRQQSEAVGRGLSLGPEVRNAALRERGDSMLRNNYRPLIDHP